MERRRFGTTDLQLSVLGLGGLLARYEAALGHPPPEEKRAIYLRATELGVTHFDTGYGDEVHIPDELKGPDDGRTFSLKMGAPKADTLASVVEGHLRSLRREAIDILRVHHRNWSEDGAVREAIEGLRQAGKVRALCLIRHYAADQAAYAARGPEAEADGDLVIYNVACRHQAPGLEAARQAGKGVLIMKALGGQWLPWDEQVRHDWAASEAEDVVRMGPKGERLRGDLGLIYPIVNGPWRQLCAPGETVPPTHRAIRWVQDHPAVSSVLVAFASVAELEEGVGRVEAGPEAGVTPRPGRERDTLPPSPGRDRAGA